MNLVRIATGLSLREIMVFSSCMDLMKVAKHLFLKGCAHFLFGGTHKAYGPMTGALDVERNGESYYIGRKGKQLDFYSPGNPAIHEEPAQRWWHGIDKKTYNRIFALTLDDLQGLDVLQEVEVRSRFFGAEGGEHLGSVVKEY